MRRRLKVAAAALLALAGITAHTSWPAMAESAFKPAFQAAEKALASVQPSLKPSEANASRLPGYNNAEVADHLQKVWNIDALIASRPSTGAEMQDLMKWMQTSLELYKAYLFWKSGGTNAEQINQNVKTYAPELARGSAFNIYIASNAMQASNDFKASLSPEQANDPVRQEGLSRMTDGLVQVMTGSINFCATDKTEDVDSRLVSSSLAAEAHVFKAYITPDHRAKLQKEVQKVVKLVKDERVIADLKEVEKVLGQ
jgi:hypothetical protein